MKNNYSPHGGKKINKIPTYHMKWKFYKHLLRERKQVAAIISLTSRREFSQQMWNLTDSGWEEESHTQKINLTSRPFQARQINV